MNLNCILEFPIVIMFSILFLFLLTSSYDFFALYLSIEGLSLTLYVLAGMLHQNILSIEAAIKYFSLGAISSGILLLGISILFSCIGILDFLEINIFLTSINYLKSTFEIKVSLIFILFGFFFKVASFPCHFWVADVYEGIWTPITAFFAITIKIGLLLLMFRFIFSVLFNIMYFFQPIFIIVAIGSMVVGALGAFKQLRIKRFIAYTSINQVGFIFLGLASCNLMGLISALVYLILYSVMSISFFNILLNSCHIVTGKSMLYLSDLYCFCFYNSEISKHLSLIVLSMGGLPPLGGFIGKLFLYFAVMEARLDLLIFFSLFISIISVYYYLSFVRYIWFEKYKVLKLYYFNKNIFLELLLRLNSLILVLFGIISSKIIANFTILALSCL